MATFKPSNSSTSSVSLVWFSNAMWYWKPEQPPPTTATRKAAGTGDCIAMISLTLLAATDVRLIIIPRPPLADSTDEDFLPTQYNITATDATLVLLGSF